MALLKKIKEKIIDIKKLNILREPVYMQNNAAFVCQDKQDKVTKTTKIIAEHADDTPDIPIEFPRFIVTKTSSREGTYGMFHKVALVLDTDDEPIEGSNNLLTSGALFHTISILQEQIDELKALIQK